MGDEWTQQQHQIGIYYNAARAEIIERMKLRDDMLKLYFTAFSIVSSIAGLMVSALFATGSLNDPASAGIIRLASFSLLILPLFARATLLIVCQHHVLIGSIERYLVLELGAHSITQGSKIRHWDASHSVMDQKHDVIVGRARGLQFLVVVSCVVFLLIFAAIQATLGYLTQDSLMAVPSELQTAVSGHFEGIETLLLTLGAGGLLLAASWLTLSCWQIIHKATRIRTGYLKEIARFISQNYD